MQAEYPKQLPKPHWDTVNVEFPVKKFPEIGLTSETIGHVWRGTPEILREIRDPLPELKEYMRDYNVTKELTKSQTAIDFSYKLPETERCNKHTSSTDKHYIYPQYRRITDRPPLCSVYGTTEMRSAFKPPTVAPRLVTNKDQYKHPKCLSPDLPEPSWHKDLEPLDTTYDGFEKYLDLYLTTSRLHHRPYTADQLNKQSASKDVVTYYTFANVPWTRTPKPKLNGWFPPTSRPKSMYDREKFKEDCREIRIHNKLNNVPGGFRTETRDNYAQPLNRPELQPQNYEKHIRHYYEKSLADLSTNISNENIAIKGCYASENSIVGSGRPVCSVLDQYAKNNRRLSSRHATR